MTIKISTSEKNAQIYKSTIYAPLSKTNQVKQFKINRLRKNITENLKHPQTINTYILPNTTSAYRKTDNYKARIR